MSGENAGLGLDGLAWFKSSYSAGDGGECVEVATCPDRVRVRDSKDATRVALAVQPRAWTAFIEFAAL
ncbi:DUF397 domain-containing protein [Streptomyces antibioticus]|uniref:DUF397 domain-containing protein n=1 Tax=Streptomyces antibioticus TaxID=1890 RepID=A0AAE7CK61_STRAT|nr:DUF397 domain-containing protein [Streptomyces antibioticus]OOQ53051.1 toxin-antitoxin system, toxin component [Streptomyces antibioticus]QIT44210.1 DUF397 domain-containing protein [Streptomyces antibioticus]